MRKGYGTGMVCGGRGVCVPDWKGSGLLAALEGAEAALGVNASTNGTVAAAAASSPKSKPSSAPSLYSDGLQWAFDLPQEAAVMDASGLGSRLTAALAAVQASSPQKQQQQPLMELLASAKLAGVCKCLEGFAGPACEQRVVLQGHGSCDSSGSGACTCSDIAAEDRPAFPGQKWDGPACEKRSCKNGCSGKGMCDGKSGQCACFPGWGGSDCSQAQCRDTCSYRGRCVLKQQEKKKEGEAQSNGTEVAAAPAPLRAVCECDAGWGGESCSQRVCHPSADCSGHGTCSSEGVCVCAAGWSGADCASQLLEATGSGAASSSGSTAAFLRDASANGAVLQLNMSSSQEGCGGCGGADRGLCVKGLCFCNTGFSGTHCELQACPAQCSGHGVCNGQTGTCTCLPPWTGNDCSSAPVVLPAAAGAAAAPSPSPVGAPPPPATAGAIAAAMNAALPPGSQVTSVTALSPSSAPAGAMPPPPVQPQVQPPPPPA